MTTITDLTQVPSAELDQGVIEAYRTPDERIQIDISYMPEVGYCLGASLLHGAMYLGANHEATGAHDTLDEARAHVETAAWSVAR